MLGRAAPAEARAHDREILRLAVPAFLALVTEPLFLLADAAIVGHLGTPQLAALGIAGAVVQTVVGLCVFLAYGTTAAVARRIGAGDLPGALRQGVDGMWLAVLIGIVATAGGLLLTDRLVGLFEAEANVATHAMSYLAWAWLGVTPLLLILATTGILRGLQDTRTPLYVAVLGNLANIGLNLLLVYGAGLGLIGSAIGTDLAQLAMAGALVLVVVRGTRRHRVGLRPHARGIGRAAHSGIALLVRTLTLRASLLVTTYVAASFGSTELAAHQLAITIWIFLSFALDAVAIAAQAITGRYLGAGDVRATRSVTSRMIWWGLVSGIVTGIGLAAIAPALGILFTGDESVQDALLPVLLVAAVFQPIAGVVFVLDGVLIGAGDGRFLAWAGLLVFVVFAPLALVATSLVWLWVAFGVAFMGGRLVVLELRARGTAWMVTGAA